jgi:Zn finger protein HypA/HybF involved in hydrogenase expression
MSKQDLVALVSQQKALARRNRNVRNGIILVCVLLGLLVSFAWLIFSPTDSFRPEIKLIAGITAGGLLGYFFIFTHDAKLFPQKAACPTCGHNWEIVEGDHVPLKEKMASWDRCPGCGSLMNEVLLAKQKPVQSSN